ncbi:MAG: Wzz/FepE/Etk N-terminal domain-containing protein [Candidatus Acidiferrum sp.]
MVRNGEISVTDAKRVLRRYWWILPLSTVLLGSFGYIATCVLPKKYTSETSVLVEQPVVSADYVKPVESDDLNMRLASMKAQVLSGPRLQPIIEKLNLYSDQRANTSMDDLIGQLQKAVDVKLLEPMPGSYGRPPGFHVGVTFTKPLVAQQICTEITSMFMEQNAQRRMDQSQNTTQFMGEELQVAKAKLDEQDQKLAQFKRQYLGTLPEEEQSNLSLLTGLNTQLEAATQALGRSQQEKAFDETMLNQQEATWKGTQTGGPQNPDTMAQQLAALQDQLSVMLTRYTPQHPDVLKVKSQIEALKRRMSVDPGTKTPSEPSAPKLQEPPELQQMRTKVQQDDLNIADLAKSQSQIQQQIRLMQARVQASPMVEEKYKELTRDYQTAQQIYNDLLKKQSDSSIAKDLEHEQESEVFRVLDPPSYPSAPSFPKLIIFLGGGLAGGFALAVGVLYLLAILDKAMYSERDVELSLKLPVLTMVPTFSAIMEGGSAKRGKSENYKHAVALKV